jgi:NagD protein
MPKSFLIDMDGVLVRGRSLIPGADAFLDRLRTTGSKFLLLTNNPIYTPRDLQHRLGTIGLNIEADQVFTSAMATARFLDSQRPKHRTAFVIGESGLTEALHEVGFVITDHEPAYVVLGETHSYNFEMITKATRFVAAGAHFIATNPDASGPAEKGIEPACGALAALVAKASGVDPFFIGKPNPLMMRTALNYLGVHSEETVMVGDNMQTDIIGGVQAGLETILVLSGVTTSGWERYSYQPTRVVGSVADIEIAEQTTIP